MSKPSEGNRPTHCPYCRHPFDKPHPPATECYCGPCLWLNDRVAAALKWAADTVEKFYIDGTPTSAMPELIDQIKAGPSSEGAEKEGE